MCWRCALGYLSRKFRDFLQKKKCLLTLFLVSLLYNFPWVTYAILHCDSTAHGRRRSKYFGGNQTFCPKNMSVFIRKLVKHIIFGSSIFIQSLFHINIFVAKLGNDLKSNSTAVANYILSCDSLGISKMLKYEKSQHQKIGIKKVVKKITQNKLYHQQVWMLAENRIMHMYLL